MPLSDSSPCVVLSARPSKRARRGKRRREDESVPPLSLSFCLFLLFVIYYPSFVRSSSHTHCDASLQCTSSRFLCTQTGRKSWKQYLYRAIIVLLVLATGVGLPAHAQLSLQVSTRIWIPSGIVLVCVFAVPTPTYIESEHDGSKLAAYPAAATKKDA